METPWHTHSINTAECFAHRGFFTVTLDARIPVFVPHRRGMSHVGNLIRVPQGEVKRTLAPAFSVTVDGGEPFPLPGEAVREIRDADSQLICCPKEVKAE